jgi:hypothetical protein
MPSATYLELAPAGHCPHHEAPTAINSIITTWVAAVEQGQHTQHDLLQVRLGVEDVGSCCFFFLLLCSTGKAYSATCAGLSWDS